MVTKLEKNDSEIKILKNEIILCRDKINELEKRNVSIDSLNKTNIFIYILELDKNKYYIGKTENPKFRISNHFNSNGSEWTKKYNPIKLIDLIQNSDDFDEDKYTLIYMKKYGINNVRGGTFSHLNLETNVIETLTKMINNDENKCFTCGELGHFAKECKKNNMSQVCFNCKEIGHFSKDCTKINKFKCDYCERTFETRNGATYHANYYCKNKKKLI